jgi:hypothetical protein
MSYLCEIFSIQRALPTMAYGQVFRIITRKLPRDPTFPPLIQQLCGFESVEHSPVPSEGIDFASMMSNTYFVFCFSSYCLPYVARFSCLSVSVCLFVII